MARVLVAEDDRPLAELVRVNLTDRGHDVVLVEDGRYALKLLVEDRSFDVVVLDLMMPWSDGYDVLGNLGGAGPRIVVLTARTDDYSEQRARDLGVDVYLTKPYDPDELAAVVERLAEEPPEGADAD